MDVLAICIILGSIILIIGIGYLINRLAFMRKAKVIKGKIIRIKEDYINNRKSFFPTIEYSDYNGKRSVYESNTGYRRSKYRINDIVNLRYLRVNKKNVVCEDTPFALYGVSLIFIPIGLLFCVIGILGVGNDILWI